MILTATDLFAGGATCPHIAPGASGYVAGSPAATTDVSHAPKTCPTAVTAPRKASTPVCVCETNNTSPTTTIDPTTDPDLRRVLAISPHPSVTRQPCASACTDDPTHH